MRQKRTLKNGSKKPMKVFKMLVFLMFLNFSIYGYGQELTGVIRGIVSDQSGLVVEKTKINATGPMSMIISSDSNGGYVLVLVPGEYILNFEKDGFSSLKKNVSVRAGGNVVLNVVLEVAGVSETITVEEKTPEIDTGSSAISTNVRSDVQTKLPSGTGFLGLLTRAPGVRVEPVGGGIMSDGSSRAENNFYVGGVNVSDADTGSIRVMNNTPSEFMEETQINRSGDAKFGGALGSVVNGVLRRGGNNIHGQIMFYAADDSMNASPNPFLKFSSTNDDEVEYFKVKKDSYRLFMPGYAVGGPIVKNKVFFFSGSRPSFSKTERPVKFLKNNLPGDFSSSSRQDFVLNKLDSDLVLWNRPLQLSLAYMYSPWRVRGFLPSQDGTDSPDTLWYERGFRAPSALILWKGTYFPTDKLIVSAYGGQNYTNFKDAYGLSVGPSISYLTSNLGLEGVPRKFQATSGDFTPNNFQTQKDKFSRNNLYLDASYLAHWKGSHFVSFGYQRDHIQNDTFANTWPNGRFLIAWNRSWQGVVKNSLLTGKYGFYIEDKFETSGNVESRNHAFYFQDSWQIRKNLTWNLGLRAESEYVPSFLVDERHGPRAISFGFYDKIAPRLGIAYDPTSSGKSKISAGFSVVNDTIKNNLPKSAFGGDKWLQCFFPLNDADVLNLKRGDPKKAFECLNLRVPANDLIDPALKPMQQRMFSVGYEKDFGNNWLLSVYGIHKSLVRAIEDVGRLVVNNGIVEEQYTITNPGEGRSIDPSWFSPGYPSPITPRARRDYRALEVNLEKRSSSYLASGSYTLSRLWGNYSGLASSDERGRINPNTNRDFDLSHMARDKNSRLVYGRLATDRPHVFKFFGYKTISTRLGNSDLGTSFIWQSGTPLSTQVPVLTSAPAFAYGRGDMGRTAKFSETSLNYGHEFKLPEFNEHQKIRIEWTVANVFNQHSVLDKVTWLVHPNDGHIYFPSSAAVFKGYEPEELMEKQNLRKSPAYGMPSAFQAPRSMRLALRFFF